TASCFALLLLSVSILFPYTTLFRSVALFLLGAQSTFFGPIKYAYLPQAMHKDELVGANALFQTGTSLSILMGMIVAGVFTQLDNHLYWVSAMALLIAGLGLLSSKFVPHMPAVEPKDRKSTRLNSSHVSISYAVFCLKKKRP